MAYEVKSLTKKTKEQKPSGNELKSSLAALIVVNCLLAKLPSKERIIPHKDSGIHLLLTNRIHLPIKTNPNVKFYIEGKAYEFAAGRCFELSNEKQHSVQNLSNEDRVHLIVDILPKYFRQFLNNPQN